MAENDENDGNGTIMIIRTFNLRRTPPICSSEV